MLQKVIELPYAKYLEKKLPPNIFKGLFALILIYSFLGTMNFLSYQGAFIIVSAGLMLAYILLKGRVTINIPTILVIIFVISYVVPIYVFTKPLFESNLLYSGILILFIQLFECFPDKKKFVIGMTGSYVLGLFAAFILIVIRTYWEQGASFDGDALTSMWTGEMVARTGLSLYGISAIGISFAILFTKNRFRKWYIIPLLVFVIVGCSFVSIKVGNRSFILTIAVLLLSMFIFNLCVSQKKVLWGILSGVTLTGLVGGITVIVLYQKGYLPFLDSLKNIKIIARILETDFDGGRIKLWSDFFKDFYKYPFGGLILTLDRPYVHNIFLDFYAYAGAIPFLLFLGFLVFLLIYLFKYSKRSDKSLFEKNLLFSIIFAIISLSMIEPMYQANSNSCAPLFFVFLFVRHECINNKEIKQADSNQEVLEANAI